MNVNRKKFILRSLCDGPKQYRQLEVYFTEAQELLGTEMINRYPGPTGVYAITKQGRNWLNLVGQKQA